MENNKLVYELTVRVLEPFTAEEIVAKNEGRRFVEAGQFSDRPFHERRALQVELSQEQFENLKKGVLSQM